MNDLASQIEAFLRESRTWVKAAEICLRFGVKKRALRGLNGAPGLCGGFAVSNTRRGYKHLDFATEAEAMHAYRQRRQHGIGELVSARRMIRRWRERVRATTRPMQRDGQLLLVA